jgi:hypothetical protein
MDLNVVFFYKLVLLVEIDDVRIGCQMYVWVLVRKEYLLLNTYLVVILYVLRPQYFLLLLHGICFTFLVLFGLFTFINLDQIKLNLLENFSLFLYFLNLLDLFIFLNHFLFNPNLLHIQNYLTRGLSLLIAYLIRQVDSYRRTLIQDMIIRRL